MTSCLLSCTPIPSEKGSTIKGKTLLPKKANSFLLEYTPFQKGYMNLTELPCLKACPFPLIER